MRVACQQIPAGDADHQRSARARPCARHDRGRELADVARVGVALEGDLVAAGHLPIGPEAEVAHLPPIGSGLSFDEAALSIESLGEDAKEESGLELAAVAPRA